MSVVSMYKDGLVESTHLGENFAGLAIAAFTAARELESSMSVSYTHLTQPTNSLV